MNRIKPDAFEKILKDKYDVDWIGDIVGNGIYIKEKYTQNEHIVSEHELIGIMVTELKENEEKDTSFHFERDKKGRWHSWKMVMSYISIEDFLIYYTKSNGEESLYEALRKGVEGVF